MFNRKKNPQKCISVSGRHGGSFFIMATQKPLFVVFCLHKHWFTTSWFNKYSMLPFYLHKNSRKSQHLYSLIMYCLWDGWMANTQGLSFHQLTREPLNIIYDFQPANMITRQTVVVVFVIWHSELQTHGGYICFGVCLLLVIIINQNPVAWRLKLVLFTYRAV